MHKVFTRRAPPISLKDVADRVGVAALGTVVAALEGAIEQGTKYNETWRYELGGCVIVGYKSSAVVAGDRPALVPLVAARVRAAVLPAPSSLVPLALSPDSELVRDVPELPSLVPLALSPDSELVRDVPELLHTGGSYDLARDWTEQPWAGLWIVHRRALGPQMRAFGEQYDPFAWAVREGLID